MSLELACIFVVLPWSAIKNTWFHPLTRLDHYELDTLPKQIQCQPHICASQHQVLATTLLHNLIEARFVDGELVHLSAMTTIVGPPTYPAPVQQIFTIYRFPADQDSK